MNGDATFWALVRHELKLKGSWKKRGRSPVAKYWWYVYTALMILAGLGAATYFAVHQHFPLQGLWYATFGFPYMLYFFGFGSIKREAENDTLGWWLTMPLPRHKLVAAKWLSAWLMMMGIMLASAVVGVLYTSALAAILPSYTMADVGTFLAVGFNWCVIWIGFSPLLAAAGLLTSAVQLTTLRPLFPILMLGCMTAGGFMYSGFATLSSGYNIYKQFSGEQPIVLYPYPWGFTVAMIASWLAAYLVVRLTGWMLDKRLYL